MKIPLFLRSIIRILTTPKLRAQFGEWNANRIPFTKIYYRKTLKRIKKEQHANIVLIASSLSMWKFDDLTKLLNNDSHFKVVALIIPFNRYSKEIREEEVKLLKEHFESEKIPYKIILDDNSFKNFKNDFNIDLIFYPQPYNKLYFRSVDWRQNLKSLICYVPYSLSLAEFWWTADLPFHNSCWQIYYPYKEQIDAVRVLARNKAKNAICCGDLRADIYSKPIKNDPWKKIKNGLSYKRVIWAPHFQMNEKADFNRPDFVWTSEIMLKLAKRYKNSVQFAFKPHPRLKSELYNHPNWGKDKTDAYFHEWEILDNTQYEEGEYYDLFKTSDAIIHNCGSFAAEYFYVNKPAAFTTRNLNYVIEPMHSFGKKCIDAHYIVSTEEQIVDFIENVLLKGEDPLKENRKLIFKNDSDCTSINKVAQTIYLDLKTKLKLQNV